jgi:hypothetical protein
MRLTILVALLVAAILSYAPTIGSDAEACSRVCPKTGKCIRP